MFRTYHFGLGSESPPFPSGLKRGTLGRVLFILENRPRHLL
jgi:hypothetical protein